MESIQEKLTHIKTNRELEERAFHYVKSKSANLTEVNQIKVFKYSPDSPTLH